MSIKPELVSHQDTNKKAWPVKTMLKILYYVKPHIILYASCYHLNRSA